ncbi:phage/plasmid primase, P4 family [Lysinibacillus capsici]|uniref:DNA primase family protein n=1 Tax=Lysinibacillus capsici TaxID=2115968 RepID=UPI002731122F|nr:phage/plasmid primase, P4 family [Lysinibacillus capsici]MDP1394425.1 phage/plasmid primase, P4 family [Lysinibacillus capsici]MDP1414904.1 phage/plasmid primase, P4 family [Lysinibacillus capsici]MDP1430799.1 phage/plasmid primase, P4 family [Lysinibacillus capsici]
MKNDFKSIEVTAKKINNRPVNKSAKKRISVNSIDLANLDSKQEESLAATFKSSTTPSGYGRVTMRSFHPNKLNQPIETDIIDIKNSIQKRAGEIKSNESSSPFNLANALISEFKFILINDILHVWSPNEGIYISLEQNNAEKFIRKYSPMHIKKHLTTAKIKEILRWIESTCQAYDCQSQTNKKQYIVFKNGLYNLSTNQLEDFDPSLIVTNKLDVDYNECSKTSKYFVRFINDITDGDLAFYHQLQELFGYVISEVRDVKTLPILLGPKDSGKSICLKILEALVGEKNCSSVSLAQLQRSEFLSELHNKKLNTCGEISSSINFSIELLKQLTGGDTLMARRLFNDPIKFSNSAAMVFAGNSLPSFSNKDSHNALLKRINLFYFTKSTPPENQDIYLLEKILSNMDYVGQWALEGFLRWRDNDFIFTQTEKSKYFIEQVSLISNSVEAFIQKNCVFKESYSIYKQNFIQSYYDYCIENNIDPQPANQIDKLLIENYSIKRKKARLDGESPKSAYFGIKLNSIINMEEL